MSLALPSLPSSVAIREVSLRDGLQILKQVVPTDIKKQWLKDAYQAGLKEVEVGSFVPAKYLPQLADTAAVVTYAKRFADMCVSALVPNLRGAVDALDSGVDALMIPVSASVAHSEANLHKTPQQMLAQVAQIRELRDQHDNKALVEVGVSTAFGCTIQGKVEPQTVLDLIRALLDAGVDKISLADTVGYADPGQVQDLFTRGKQIAGEKLWAAHFHDTRGLGLANVLAAMQTGIRRFDACLAGIGGCPHAPGASGNVSTEDVAYMLLSMGIETGLDFDALLALRSRIGGWLGEGVPLYGHVWRAGLPKTLQPV